MNGVDLKVISTRKLRNGLVVEVERSGRATAYEIIMTRAQKRHICDHCKELIEPNERMIVVRWLVPIGYWRRWGGMLIGKYHPSCFEKTEWVKELELKVLKTTIRMSEGHK